MGIKTHDIKKGALVRLDNGMEVIVQDNRRTTSRLVQHVKDDHLGEVPVWKMQAAQVGGEWVPIELTSQQLQSKRIAGQLGVG